jgi:hypothetical protein
MDFVRWYSGPVIVGFCFSLLVNPLIAGLGILIWLALIYYIFKTISRHS